MTEPYNIHFFPNASRYWYPRPFGEFAQAAELSEGRTPGSDPAVLARQVLDEKGVRAAILIPQGRGLFPDLDVMSAVCSATNQWLAETWLEGQPGSRFLGTIRVNPLDPDSAVTEIEKWAAHPRMIQIAVPLEAHAPYGHRRYRRMWEVAAHHGLPVVVHREGGCGTDLFPVATGMPNYHIEYNSMWPVNYFYHMSSLIAEGVFERLPNLKFVFPDGGFSFMMPLMWRMDMDWPISRIEVPWVKKRPLEYLQNHFRFLTAKMDILSDDRLAEWMEISQGLDLLLFGSSYPDWSMMTPEECLTGLEPVARRRVLSQNAIQWYGLESRLSLVG
jgi:predicted TIM-barrel fold metal-dependent hydrolase